MKRNTILAVALAGLPCIISTMTFAAERHLVLFEKFTNVGCQPCAVFAPPADSLLDARLGDVVEVTYHGNYPYPNDEYYLPVKDQVQHRIDHYGVRGYPSVFLDGKSVDTYVTTIDYMINRLMQTDPEVRLNVSTSLEEGLLSVNVETVSLYPLNNSDLRLFVAAVEEEVRPARPAYNGQTVFHNEFRQFLTPPSGEPISAFPNAGDSHSWSGTWQVERIEKIDELAVVAWVQDMKNGTVVETAYVPRPAKKELDARVMRVADTPEQVCDPLFSGRLWLRNTGAETLTDCEIAIDICGDVHTFPWKGELPYLATEEIAIPPFTDFEIDPEAASSAVKFSATALNGSGSSSEPFAITIPGVLTGNGEIRLLVSTDNKPQETSWRILDANGEVVCESEPYTERRHDYLTVLPLPADGCYTLEFHDAGGDGITGSYGKGYFRLYEADGDNMKELKQDDFKGESHTLLFRAANLKNASVAMTTESRPAAIVYDAASRQLLLPRQGECTVTDLSGRRVLNAGGSVISVASLPAGVYVARLSGDADASLKFIVE